jgi:thiol-disulfide isomerase/thioredoxin
MACVFFWVAATLMLTPTTSPAASTGPAEVADVREINAAGVGKLLHESRTLQLVTVWATWCSPCVAEMPGTAELARQFSDRGLRWTTISIDEPRNGGRVYEFLAARNITAANFIFTGKALKDLVNALDPADTTWDGSPPHTLLVAPGGKVVYRHVGPVDRDELISKIREHLKDR